MDGGTTPARALEDSPFGQRFRADQNEEAGDDRFWIRLDFIPFSHEVRLRDQPEPDQGIAKDLFQAHSLTDSIEEWCHVSAPPNSFLTANAAGVFGFPSLAPIFAEVHAP